MIDHAQFNDNLLEFIQRSPTPFHAVQTMIDMLDKAGFQPLKESDTWELDQGGRYYVTRNDSSIIAFVYGNQPLTETGIRMVGAHTDSPCLKVKPNPELNKHGYFQLGVELYGGVLLNPWFDRDLSMAGRVTYLNDEQMIDSGYVDFLRPIASIPSLAIHLDREANSNRSINAQKHLPPILAMSPGNGRNDAFKSEQDFKALLKKQLLEQDSDLDVDEILDYEICLYDTQAGSILGLDNEFIASARLDNLLSCYVGMQALLEAGDGVTSMLVCSDHEEVGSASAAGAQGPMLKSVLDRMMPNPEDYARCIDQSMLISADNAHAIHPNYADKHDENHGPKINAGPVIKINANQRYASNSETQAVFRYLAQMAEVPVQSFVVRSDMGCGSTIGPITATEIGIKTLDVGVPTFGMHSIRETAGTHDALGLYQVLGGFFRQQALWAN